VYSDKHVNRRLEIAQREFQREFTDLGFPKHQLKYRTVSEVSQFESHLRESGKYVYNDKGVITGLSNLTAEESLWILNEQLVVKCDHAYGITRYGWLIDEEGAIHRFHFRTAQKIIFSVIADLEEHGYAIEIMALKARQLGITTLVQLLILLRIVFGYGVNAVAASAEKEKSGLMAKKLFLAYDHMPVWLVPRPTARSEEGDQPKLVFGQLNTTLSVQHGKKMSGGVAQGWTPTIYHLSEVALFPDANSQINMGLWKAVHASPNILGILESTGAGDTGWWPDTWRYSKDHWATRECRMCPLFLPWFVGREIYPKEAWIRQRPVPDLFYERRLPKTREHVAKAELYVSTNPLLRKYLGENWKMPLEQQWFWEVGHQEAVHTGSESTWFQEMAGDDEESLQRSEEGVFHHELIYEIEERAKPAQSHIEFFGLAGQSIEDRHEPHTDDIDYDKKRVGIKWKSTKSEETYKWELIPVKHDADYLESIRKKTEVFRMYPDCRLMVWHPPQRNVEYALGIDTGGGRGGDSSVISVIAKGKRGLPDVQCAEFRSSFVSHTEIYPFALAIAAWYGQFAEAVNQLPMVSIEQIASIGDVCQSEMRKLGYPVSRFFDFGRYDSRKIKQIGNRKGWFTNSWSRPILCGSFISNARNGWVEINSIWTIEEMRHWETHYTASGIAKPEHSSEYWDDGIFALAIACFTSHDMESQAERTSKQYRATREGEYPEIDVRDWDTTNKWSTKPNKYFDLNDL
jgi:hypothetical protein